MDKRKLLGLPVATHSGFITNAADLQQFCCFRSHTINDAELLVVDCFKHGENEPVSRIFLSPMDFTSYTYQCASQSYKWTSGMIRNVILSSTDDVYSYRWHWPIADEESRIPFERFFHITFNAETAMKVVSDYQKDISSVRLNQRHRRALDKLREPMALIRPMPKGIDDWIDNTLLKKEQYILYEYSRRKKMKAFCTVCQSAVEISGVKHRQKCICPNCKAESVALSGGKMPDDWFSRTYRGSVVQKYGTGDIVVRMIGAYRKFHREPGLCVYVTTHSYEYCRDIMSLSKTEKGKPYIGNKAFEIGIYKKMDNIGEGWIPYMGADIAYGPVFPENMKEELNGTWAQYSALDRYAAVSDKHPARIDFYLEEFLRNPKLELVVKSGLYQLAYEMANANSFIEITDEELNAVRLHIPEVRQWGGGISLAKVFLQIELNNIRQPKDEIRRWCELTNCNAHCLKDLTKISSLKKINDYMEASKSHNIETLRDYWHMTMAIGMNMKDNRVLFPSDLLKAHDKANKEYTYHRSQIVQKAIFGFSQQLKSQFSFSFNGLCIVVPQSEKDFIEESKKLKHCVRTYIDRYARRETVILFVRKQCDPKTPYFTMEVLDGKIAQLRGMCNCIPGNDVISFATAFSRKFHLKNAFEAA